MASSKILDAKKAIVSEITDKIKNSESVILFEYQGLTVAEVSELRKKLRSAEGEVRVYKNTLLKRSLDDLNIDLNDSLNGPSAFAYGEDQVAPIKVLTDFAKEHPAVILKVGIIDGEVADKQKLSEYASLPSRDGLLTMLAGGMIGLVKDLSICLDLYAKQKEENE